MARDDLTRPGPAAPAGADPPPGSRRHKSQTWDPWPWRIFYGKNGHEDIWVWINTY